MQQEQAAKARRRMLFASGGVVGVLLLVGLIVGLASGLVSKRGGDDPVEELAGKPADVAPVADAPADVPAAAVDVGPVSVAPADKGLTMQDLLASAVPADGWAVAPDGVAPIDVDRRLLFDAPSGVGHILQFAAPGTAHAAFVGLGQHNKCTWVRYDLRKPPYPVGEAELPINAIGREGGESTLVAGWPAQAGVPLLDLSPDGLWLAGAIRTKFVSVWGTDGRAVGRFSPTMPNATEQDLETANPGLPVEHSYAWVGFTDATHLALLTDDKNLELREVPSGVIESSTPVEIKESAVLSPGRKWLMGYTGDGLQCLSVPDWKPAGTLRLPAKMPAKLLPPSLAFSPDGTRFAAYFPSPDVQVLLTWDVPTGALRHAVLLRSLSVTRALQSRHMLNPYTQCRVQWTGPRTVLLNGTSVVDLDLGAVAYWYSGTDARGAPDERVWQRGVGTVADQKKTLEKLRAAVKAMGERPAGVFNTKPWAGGPSWDYAIPFFAGRLPDASLAAQLDALRDKPMLHPYRPIRVELATAGPDEFREKATTQFVEFLRRYKLAIDPQAPVTLRLVLDRPIVEHRTVSYGKIVTVDARTGAPLGVDQIFAVIRGSLQFRDSAGRVAWTTPVGAAGEGFEAITAVQAGAIDLEAAAPEALAKAREAFMRQFISATGTNTFKFGGEIVFYDQGKPVGLPLSGEGLQLDGVFDDAPKEPVK